MNFGKLTQDIFERTVHKTIQNNSQIYKDNFSGTALGADCALLTSENIVSGQALSYGNDQYAAVRAMQAAVNQVAVNKGTAKNVSFMIMAPEKLREIKIRKMIEQAAVKAEEMGLLIAAVQTQILPMVNETVVTCTVNGSIGQNSDKLYKNDINSHKIDTNNINYDIIMTKWIGLEGTSIIARANSEKLRERYPADIVEKAENFDEYFSILSEAATAEKSGVCAMQAVREGGVFGALWELAERNGVGLVIDLKNIPVKQETIEVCEYFDINPYELIGGGSLLMLAPNGARVVEQLSQEGIPATVIGYTTSDNDRIIRQDDEQRYLEPAKHDEIFKVMKKEN